MVRASGVVATLEAALLPRCPIGVDARLWQACLLGGGDDYELCFSVPPDRVAQLERVAADWECRCTRLGVITAQPGLHLLRADGCAFPLQRGGYDHFN
jgi:thiamine-monophosphate kinase